MNASKKEKKNTNTIGIKTQNDLREIPELCQLCECKAKDENPESDWNFDHCEFLEGDFKPNILCFTPKNNKGYTKINEVVIDFMLKLDKVNLDLEGAFYEDVRSGFNYLAKITRLSKAVKKQYIQALSDFKRYLDENKLNFEKKYFFPV